MSVNHIPSLDFSSGVSDDADISKIDLASYESNKDKDKSKESKEIFNAEKITAKVVEKSKSGAKSSSGPLSGIGDLVSGIFGAKKNNDELEKLKVQHKVGKAKIAQLDSDIKNISYELDNNGGKPSSKTNMKRILEEGKKIDARLSINSSQSHIEENISKLKLQGEQ